MPRQSPYAIHLSDDQRAWLESHARKYASPYRDVVRARIVLYAAEGMANDAIAARLDTPRQIVSKWRKRFAEDGLAGLEELPAAGEPARFPPTSWSPLRRWPVSSRMSMASRSPRLSIPDLRQEAVRRGLVASVGETTVWRWLSEDALRPWCHRSWIFPRDPAFAQKAGRVLDLYAGTWEGAPWPPPTT